MHYALIWFKVWGQSFTFLTDTLKFLSALFWQLNPVCRIKQWELN